jgi:RecA-family ATPase
MINVDHPGAHEGLLGSAPKAPASVPQAEASQTTPASPPHPIVRGSEYLRLPRSRETWVLEPVLPSGGSLLLYGDPKVGKSFAALQLAAALSGGQDWLGFPSRRSHRVVYIQLDTPRSLWADRVQTLRSSGLSTDDIYFADRETLNTWPFDILDTQHQALLTNALRNIETVDPLTGELSTGAPDVVILDTLRESHRGDENDATDMQNVLSHLVAAVKPAALILVAHGRKADPQRGTSLINDNRGSNYIVGAVDAIAHMTHKGLEIGGRAVDEQFIRLERQDNGTWELADRDKVKTLAREILEDPRNHDCSLRDKAGMLAQETGKTHAACLSILHRLERETKR